MVSQLNEKKNHRTLAATVSQQGSNALLFLKCCVANIRRPADREQPKCQDNTGVMYLLFSPPFPNERAQCDSGEEKTCF